MSVAPLTDSPCLKEPSGRSESYHLAFTRSVSESRERLRSARNSTFFSNSWLRSRSRDSNEYPLQTQGGLAVGWPPKDERELLMGRGAVKVEGLMDPSEATARADALAELAERQMAEERARFGSVIPDPAIGVSAPAQAGAGEPGHSENGDADGGDGGWTSPPPGFVRVEVADKAADEAADRHYELGITDGYPILRRLSKPGRAAVIEAIADCISPITSNEPGTGVLAQESCARWLRVIAAGERK